jgi:hypothetical protein
MGARVSHVATGIVQRRKVGSPTRKAVLMFMAGCASDDGTGIWTSKQNMAADLEMGKRTVQVCIDDLVKDGLVSEVGRRACRNGFTVEYRINLDAVQALPLTRENTATRAGDAPVSTRAGDAPVQDVHVTRAGRAPQDVQDVHPNLPITILEPSKSKDNAREVASHLELYASPDAVRSFISYRKRHKAGALTVTAAKRLAATLRDIMGQGFDPDDALGMAEERGWQTIKPEWYFKEKGNGAGNRLPETSGGRANRADPALEQIARLAGIGAASRDDRFGT